jgi:subtilisin-like proprotein convertase family protein
VEVDIEYANRLTTGITLHSPVFTQPGSIISVTDGVNSDNGQLQSINLNFARGKESILVQTILDTEMLV